MGMGRYAAMSALWVRWGPRLRFSSAIGADTAPICTTGGGQPGYRLVC